MRDRQAEADRAKFEARVDLSMWKGRGLLVAAYGAAAKATVWLNWVGATSKDIMYVVDSTPAKQGKYMPGTDIQIVSPARLELYPRPDIVIILAHNYAAEIMAKIPEGIKCVVSL